MYLARVAGAAAWAALRTLIRRTRRGPTLPTWTWGEELFVAVSRATAKASARNVALMTPRGKGLRPPLNRAARAALTVERVDLLGVQAERYCPNTTPSGTILWFHGGGFVAELPPLLIIAGGAESLLSCAERIHANARRDGANARLTVYPDKVPRLDDPAEPSRDDRSKHRDRTLDLRPPRPQARGRLIRLAAPNSDDRKRQRQPPNREAPQTCSSVRIVRLPTGHNLRREAFAEFVSLSRAFLTTAFSSR